MWVTGPSLKWDVFVVGIDQSRSVAMLLHCARDRGISRAPLPLNGRRFSSRASWPARCRAPEPLRGSSRPLARDVMIGHPRVGAMARKDLTAQSDIEALAIAEQRYRALVRATSSLVWTTSPDGQIVDMPEWRTYTGLSVDQIQGWGWLDS